MTYGMVESGEWADVVARAGGRKADHRSCGKCIVRDGIHDLLSYTNTAPGALYRIVGRSRVTESSEKEGHVRETGCMTLPDWRWILM